MLRIILAIFVAMVPIALINWKMPWKRAQWWSRLPCFGVMVVIAFSPASRNPPFTSILEYAIILVLIIPMLFFTTFYIQYIKDKTNAESMKEMFSEVIYSFAITLIAALAIAYYYLYFMGYF